MRPIDAEAFKKYIDAQEGRPFIGCTVGEAMKILIDEQPTIQCEPKKGHWKKDESDDCPIVFQQFRICSVCGTIEMSETNYCPHCGAKMTISK